MTTRQKLALFAVILVFPAILGAVTAKVAFTRAESVEFCASCHTMTPWIEDVTGAESESVASDHYKNRWIQHSQCYTCHSNYGFLGPLEAKIKGMHHLVAFYAGTPGPIDLYDPFPNENCLQCHEQGKGFREDSNHEPLEDLLSGKDRCVECHDSLHDVEQEEAAEAEDADESAEEPEPEDAGEPAGETESEDASGKE